MGNVIKSANTPMKTTYYFFALLISTSFFSQTKLIAFKSHSGNTDHFNSAVSENLFDANFSNLGIPPQSFVDVKLDSVIILNEEESVLVTRSSSKFLIDGNKREWDKNREVIHYPVLFSKKNIDSVKTILKRNYNFINDMDSVAVVKFDKENKTYKEIKSAQPKKDKEKSEKTPRGLLLGILMISGASGLYSWKRNKKNNEK